MKATSYRNTKRLGETTENYLISIGPGLLNYGRKAVLRNWDPTTPRVTDKEREILTRLSALTRKDIYKS